MESFTYLNSYFSEIVPMAQEFYLLTFFVLGFLMFRIESVRQFFNSGRKGQSTNTGSLRSLSRLRDNFKNRQHEQVLDDWAYLDKYTPEALSLVVTSLLALGRPDDVGVFISKTVANMPDLKRFIHEIIVAVANPSCEVRRQHVSLALRDICDQAFDCLDNAAMRQLAVALANVNDEQRVAQLLGALASQNAAASAKELGNVVHGFVLSKNLDAAFGYLRQMLTVGAGEDSHDRVIEVVKASTEADMNDDCTSADERPRAWEAWDSLEGFEIPSEAAHLLLEWSARQTPVDVAMASRVERFLRKSGALSSSAYDALVRVHATSAGDQSKAFAFFDELVAGANDTTPSEKSLVGMISGCVEARNGSLAEYIFKWTRKEGRATTAVFSATLKVLAAAKQSEQIVAIYEAASSSERLALDEGVCGQIINAAAQAGRAELAQNLFHRTKQPSGQNYISLMRACGQEGKVDKALELLRELQANGDVDTVTYNCALDICVSCGKDADAKALFQEMKSSRRTDVVSYNIMLKQSMSEKSSSSVAVDKVLEEMREDGLKPNTSTYNSLIGAALTGGDFAKAWKIIDCMEGAGQNVDAYTLSILFKGYKQERRTMESASVGRVLALVKKHSVKVDEVLVNVALEACLALRDMNRLKDALQTFTRSGWSVQKQCSMHTYGVLIKAHGQTHNLDEAWRLWQEVTVEKRMEASEQLYGQMLDVLVGSDCLEDALKLFKEMKATHKDTLSSQGFSVAYAMIIRGFAQRKDCQRALQCYEEMKLHGTKVSLVVLNTLIDACSRVGDMVSATKIFQEMSETQCVPDVITYSTLIKGHCVNDDLDKALQLFSLMQKKGIRPDAIVFNSLLDGCAKRQMPALCEQVISDMENAGVVPSNHSASILIKLYGRCKDLDAAFRVIDDMPKKYGFKPNNAVYTCLMSACIANNRMDRAMELRRRMIEEGVLPDEKTYSTLLRGALRAASVEQCVMLVNSALDQKGVRSVRNLLDDELVKSVLILIQRRKLWDAHGQELLERLRNVGMSVQVPDASKANSNDQYRGQRGSVTSNNHNGKNGHRNSGPNQYHNREANAANDGKPFQRRMAPRA